MGVRTATRPGMRDIGRIALGLVLVVGLVVSVVAAVPGQARGLQRRYDKGRNERVLDGIPVVGGVPADASAFLAQVQAIVPPAEHLRLLVFSPDSCGSSSPQEFWFAYQLLPRTLTCDPATRWWVLFRTLATVPAGARVVEASPGLTLVDTRP